jgi:peptidoglycan/LPS O-acetylase OafA/YrhL
LSAIKTKPPPRVTLLLCACAGAATVVVHAARSGGAWSMDLPVLALLVAPYLLLAVLVAWVRHRNAEAWMLLIATMVLGVGGVALLALSAPHSLSTPEPGLAQAVVTIGVPLLQLVAVLALSLALLVRRLRAAAPAVRAGRGGPPPAGPLR